MSFDLVFIYSLLNVFFFSFWFAFVVFIALYIPGYIILGKYIEYFKTPFSRFVISAIVGIILWTYQGLIFGYLDFRFLTYLYLLVFFIIWFKRKSHKITLKNPHVSKTSLIFIAIFALGIFGQLSQFIASSFFTSTGIYSNMESANDSLLHTAYIVQIIRRFPPFEPGLAGVTVKNYHYLADFVVGDLIRVFHLPLFPTQFLYSSILASLLFGGGAYVLARLLKFSNAATILIVYLQYFSSDLIYLITFVTTRIFDFTTHPLMDGTMFLENPPRAFSFIATFGGLSLLLIWLKTKSFKIGLLTILTFATLIGFKVNTAFLAFGGISFLALYFLIKRQWIMVFLCGLLFVVSFAIYQPVNGNAGSLLYDPFNITRMFAVQPNLQTSHLELARQIYADHKNTLGALRFDIIMLMLFLVGQFGIVNLGFLPHPKLFKVFPVGFLLFLYGGVLIELIVGSLFLQPIGLTNSFNFYLPIALLLSIPTAYILGEVFKNKHMVVRIVLILILVVCTVPRFVYEIGTKTEKIVTRIQNQDVLFTPLQLDALSQLKGKTSENDIVLAFNEGTWDREYPFLSIFSERDMFLSGQGNELESHGIGFAEREKVVKTILSSKDPKKIKQLIKENNIDVLFFFGPYTLAVPAKDIQAKKLYSNKEFSFYQVSN